MAVEKPKTVKLKRRKDPGEKNVINLEMHSMARTLVDNAIQTRAELVNQLIDGGGKDLDTDCGYPTTIDPQNYRNIYAREGVAARVVDVWPEESWSQAPTIYETEDAEQETEFEAQLTIIEDDFNLSSVMARADVLSGIGRFGILLIGIDDGKELHEEVDGFDGEGGGVNRGIIYLRPFDESVVKVAEVEKNVGSPRFGQPKFYTIEFQDADGSSLSARIHWHRAVHLADNREMSDVYGVPRMQKAYNRLLDVRKVLGGSAEMFWKGGFPGYSFEVEGGETSVELDTTSLRAEMENYMLGLQRYLALEGVTAKSLAPQVADPSGHLEAQLNSIALGLGIPKRVLFGSEQGELASSQDSKTWNRRVMKRQKGYLTPFVVRPIIDRLIMLQVLPTVERYFVDWPDMAGQTDQERAEVAKAWGEAFAKYTSGGVESFVPPAEFLSIFAGVPVEQVKQIVDAAKEVIAEEEANNPEEEAVPETELEEEQV